jgi:Holliday junction resolvase-like predicted endonuclease
MRREHGMQEALESVGYLKRKRLKRAIQVYLLRELPKIKTKFPGIRELRFDLVTTNGKTWSWLKGVELYS